MLRRAWQLAVIIGLTFLGCKTTEQQTYRPVYPVPPPDGGVIVPRPLPPGPQLPPGPSSLPPGPAIRPGTPCPPAGDLPPSTHQSFSLPQPAPEASCWRPLYEPGVRLLKPEALPPESSRTEVRAAPPPSLPAAPLPPVARINPPQKEPLAWRTPVGIEHFTDLKTDSIS